MSHGCQKASVINSPVQTTTPANQNPATSAKPAFSTTQSAATTTAQAEVKTLNIGVVCWLGWPPGLDMFNGIQVMVDMDNANGGLVIGGERYKINLISYDSNNSQETEVAAVNKLVYEDKVKFIIADGMFDSAWLATTDQNKVLVATMGGDYRKNLTPNWKYDFYSCFYNSLTGTLIGWVCQNRPDLVKNYVMAVPDSMVGHMVSETTGLTWKVFGVTPNYIFYPPSAQDLSSLGTKVKSLNPSAFGAAGGGTMGDGLAIKAVYTAGYRGQIFCGGTATIANLMTIVPEEAIEGFMGGAWPIEFDPAATQMAADFKAAWIEKHGKWEGPEVQGVGQYAALKHALQEAGNLDTDKVAAVVFNGMKYESPTGLGMMISRPDLGNDRTVDSICTTYIKQVKNGQLVVLDTFSMDDAYTLFKKINPVP